MAPGPRIALILDRIHKLVDAKRVCIVAANAYTRNAVYIGVPDNRNIKRMNGTRVDFLIYSHKRKFYVDVCF